MSEVKTLQKGQMLFFEGDPSDAMYIIKKGGIEIVKGKNANSDIVLAELRPGQLLGEMAFFDQRARSASARATEDTELIVLPFTALKAQYEKFPEWLKVMMKTINGYLREANHKIKVFESEQKDRKYTFPPKMISQIMALFNLMGHKEGNAVDGGVAFPALSLRGYAGNVFFLSNYKLQLFIDVLVEQHLVKLEFDKNEQQMVVMHNHEFFNHFVDWYAEFLQEEDDKRVVLREKELEVLEIIIKVGQKYNPNADGNVSIPMSEMINVALSELDANLNVNHLDLFESKKIIDSDVRETREIVFDPVKLRFMYESWHLLYALKKVPPNA